MLKPLVQALGAWSPGDGQTRWIRDPAELLAAGWAEIVGAEVGRNSHPSRIVDGTLLITTRSSAWSAQLSFLSEHVLTAVRARIPQTPVAQLRFRVGRLPAGPNAGPRAGRATAQAPASSPAAVREPAVDAREAIARFRSDVDARQRAKRAAGWKECEGCAALIAPGGAAFCITCANARTQEQTAMVARLLFEAPWLGYAGTAALTNGLSRREYESIRASLLSRWWETLARARAAKRLSRDGRERLIASSYVLLKSKLPPEEIAPATVRNVLGDELHDLIYGTE